MKALSLILALFLALPALAQSGGIGGGRHKEVLLKRMMLDLIPYLESTEGKNDFPEVAAYSATHPNETFSDLLRKTSITLIPGVPRDDFKADRDCASHYSDPSNRYVECNVNAIPDPADPNQQPGLYSFLFHEVLVQAGLECGSSAVVPSDYSIAARMKFHKVKYEKIMPGPYDKWERGLIADFGFACYGNQNPKSRLWFTWFNTGRWQLLREKHSYNKPSKFELLASGTATKSEIEKEPFELPQELGSFWLNSDLMNTPIANSRSTTNYFVAKIGYTFDKRIIRSVNDEVVLICQGVLNVEDLQAENLQRYVAIGVL